MAKKNSKKQVAANRCNANKSTGPRTVKGKAVVKFNALRHGLTAETSVIPSTGFEENQEEFDALQLHLRSELQPIGVMEDLLVAKIAMTFWRQRRLLKSEVGEIEKNWDRWKSKRKSDLKSEENLSKASPGMFPPLEHYSSYSEGVEHLIQTLKVARDSILVLGHTPIGIQVSLEECFGRRGDANVTKVIDIGAWMAYQEELKEEPLDENDSLVDEEEPPTDVSNPDKVKETCLCLVDEAISRYDGLLEDVRKKEEHEFRIHRNASCLPSAEVSDRLLRYQGALERQLNDSIKQLERLQDRRASKSQVEESA